MKRQAKKSAESAKGESSGAKFAIKLPVQLVKRLSDGPLGEMRWQLEVPDGLILQGTALDMQKGKFFILLGPVSDMKEIMEVVNG